MTKKDIVKTIAADADLTQLKVKEIVQRTFDEIIETLNAGMAGRCPQSPASTKCRDRGMSPAEYTTVRVAALAAGYEKSSTTQFRRLLAAGRVKGAFRGPGVGGTWNIPLSRCQHGLMGPWIESRKNARRRICRHDEVK